MGIASNRRSCNTKYTLVSAFVFILGPLSRSHEVIGYEHSLGDVRPVEVARLTSEDEDGSYGLEGIKTSFVNNEGAASRLLNSVQDQDDIRGQFTGTARVSIICCSSS